MRCLPLILAVLLPQAAAADPPRPASRPAAGKQSTYIAMLTIDVGDPIWTRFGHTALMVVREREGTKDYDSTVYNYGAADFGTSGFMWRFFRGTAKFFVARTGSFNDTVNAYAANNRAVHYQKLNLTDAQVKQVIARLEHDARPENRDYVYHHLRAGCATKIRDLLDEVLGGEIRRQLDDELDPHPPRHYGRLGYAGNIWAEIANDMFMGRLHDEPQTKHFALYLPHLLMEYLQQVKVPDPGGGGERVPLAGKPSELVPRRGADATAGQGRTLVHLGYVMIGLVLLLGLLVAISGADRPRRAGVWLLIWAVPMGIAAGMMVFGAVVSRVVEGRVNELMLSYPVTDLALIWVGIRWFRRRAVAGRVLRIYAVVRLGMVLAVLAGHALGLLYQEPRVLVVLALVSTALLTVITRRFPPAGEPAQASRTVKPS